MIDRLDSECPHCGRRLKIRVEYAGLVICCNSCENLIRVRHTGEVQPATMGEVDFVPKEDYFHVRNELVSLQSRLNARDEEFRGLEALHFQTIERAEKLELRLAEIEPALSDGLRFRYELTRNRDEADRKTQEADALRIEAESRLKQIEAKLGEAESLRLVAESNLANERERIQEIECGYRRKIDSIASSHREQIETIERTRRDDFEAMRNQFKETIAAKDRAYEDAILLKERAYQQETEARDRAHEEKINEKELAHRQEIDRFAAQFNDSARVDAIRIDELQNRVDADQKLIEELRTLVQDRVDRATHESVIIDRDRLSARVERLEHELVDRSRGDETAERALREAADARNQSIELQTRLKKLQASAADAISSRDATIASLNLRLNELVEQTREIESKHSQVLSDRDATIASLNLRLNELVEQSRELESGHSRVISDRDATIASLNHRLNELVEQTRELESKHSQVLSDRDDKISVLNHRVNELNSQLHVESDKVKALVKERDSLRLRVRENAVAIDTARTKIAGAAARELELQATIDRLNERIESEGIESERIKAQAENQIDELTREHNRVLDESSKRFEAIKESLDESELKRKSEIADLESEIALLRDRHAAEIEASDERIAELELELARQGAEREHWRDRSARFERERDEQAARIADTDKRINETLLQHASEIDSLRKQIEVERDSASSARLRVEELTSARTSDERQIEEAVGELRLAERRVEELTSAQKANERRIEDLTSFLFEAERTVKELTESSTVSELRVRQAANDLRSAESRVEELTAAHSEAEKTIARLIEARSVSEREKIESAATISELSRELERAKIDRESEIGNFGRMIDSKNAEIDRLIAESAAAIDEKRAIEREFETLKQSLAETLKEKEEHKNMTVMLKQELDHAVACWNEARSAGERKIGELEARVESAESSCAGMTSELERSRSEIKRLERESSLARAERDRTRSEIERLERESSLARAEADDAQGRLSAELDRARREVADERRRAVVGAAEREVLLDRIRKLESQSLERTDDSSELLQPAVADLAIVDKTNPDFEVDRPAPDRSASVVDSLDAASASKFIDVLSQHLRVAQTLNKHLRTLYEERRYQGARGETLDARARSEELASSARSAREQIERDWLDWLRIYQAKSPRRAATRPVESGQIRRRIEVLSHQIHSVQNTNDRLRSLFQESDVAATTPSGRIEIASGAITIEVDSVATKI